MHVTFFFHTHLFFSADRFLVLSSVSQQDSLNLFLSRNMDLPNANAANVPGIGVPSRVPWSSIVGRVVEYEVRLYERDTAQINLNRLQAVLQDFKPTLSRL